MLFRDRVKWAEKYYEWAKEHPIMDDGALSVISFLDANGLISEDKQTDMYEWSPPHYIYKTETFSNSYYNRNTLKVQEYVNSQEAQGWHFYKKENVLNRYNQYETVLTFRKEEAAS